MLHSLFCSVFALLLFEVANYRRFEYFFDLQANVRLMPLKNNLRLKVKKFKNIEAQQKLEYSYKKKCVVILQAGEI